MIERLKGLFGRYVAAEPADRRRDPGTMIKASDELLDHTKRKRVIEGARDLQRNYAVARWAINKHLDYVSNFTFQANTPDAALNQRLEELMAWYERPLHCDVAARHTLKRMIRLAEARRLIDGDVFAVKLGDGRLQFVEGDRVITPGQLAREEQERWVHGVKTGPGGSMRSIAVHARNRRGGYTFEREVRAGNVLHLGYFDAFDQVRGVSPLVSAIADFQDVLEVKEYARAKAKVTQLFALAITREMADFDDEGDAEPYKVDFGKGPVKLELDPGDRAEFLESKHPSTEFQSFLTVCLQAALKSLDIPWSFYDEAYTNFFGSRAALNHYLLSVKHKRADLKEMLDRITLWRLSMWVARGVLQLPPGMTVTDLAWDWIPAGQPWWNPEQEIRADIMAINMGLRTRTEIRRERYGDDWKQVIVKLQEEEQWLKEHEVMVQQGLPAGWVLPTEPPEEEDNDDNSQEDDDGA